MSTNKINKESRKRPDKHKNNIPSAAYSLNRNKKIGKFIQYFCFSILFLLIFSFFRIHPLPHQQSHLITYTGICPNDGRNLIKLFPSVFIYIYYSIFRDCLFLLCRFFGSKSHFLYILHTSSLMFMWFEWRRISIKKLNHHYWIDIE